MFAQFFPKHATPNCIVCKNNNFLVSRGEQFGEKISTVLALTKIERGKGQPIAAAPCSAWMILWWHKWA